MEENKDKKKELTPEDKLRRQKMIVIPTAILIGILLVWWIFAPSQSDEELQQQGFNTEMPMPTDSKLEKDKAKLYEQDRITKRQQERKEIKDLAALFGKDSETKEEKLDLMPDSKEEKQPSEPKSYRNSAGSSRYRSGGTGSTSERVVASTDAYRDINTTLGSFYTTPKEDPEKKEMQEQIEELQKQLQNQQQVSQGVTMDDQMALLERSYELAAKYNNQGGAGQAPQQAVSAPTPKADESYKNGKAQMNHIGQVSKPITSALSQPMEDSVFIAELSKSRNLGFHTAVGTTTAVAKNTISACVHTNQTIIDGQSVRMRLLEAMRVGNSILPCNTIVTGMGKIQGDRLFITVTNLEHRGTIIPVELMIVDSDGQEGIFIPGSMEMSAIKEVAANLGSNLGTTINLNQQSAGDQILTDLGKGAIQGASQYIGKKMREVKVHLKEGYKVMIYQEES